MAIWANIPYAQNESGASDVNSIKKYFFLIIVPVASTNHITQN